MAEKNKSFLDILNGYFSNIDESQFVAGSKEHITIPMEWVFTEKIDRAVIERAFLNLICKANKSYKGKLSADKEFYSKISSLEIERSETGVNLVIKARDGWTKIVVTQDKDLRGPFYAIDEDRLYEEILKVYNLKSVGQICQEFNLSMEERENFIAQLRQPEKHQSRKNIVIEQMGNAAENLTNYYDYMSKRKTKYEALSGAIQQRKDKGQTRTIRGGTTEPRKSEIYDLQDREQILQDMNPRCIINIDRIEEDNSVSKFAYVTYVYENPRGRQGYLFVAEPFEGNHNTRVRFVSQEEYEGVQVAEGRSKLVYLAENITEMSNDEFTGSKFSKRFKHTSIEKYREKFRRIVLGETVESPTEELRYAEADRILFEGETKVKKDKISQSVSEVGITQASLARGLLYARTKEDRGIQIPQ